MIADLDVVRGRTHGFCERIAIQAVAQVIIICLQRLVHRPQKRTLQLFFDANTRAHVAGPSAFRYLGVRG
eukprot:4189861-Prymnesium_polylepis.1